jgi:hypothetical protein
MAITLVALIAHVAMPIVQTERNTISRLARQQ